MTRYLIILGDEQERAKAALWASKLPEGTRVEFKAPRRSLPQNDRMWAMLTELSKQLPWHGIKMAPEDWKLVMLNALNSEVRLVPNVDGTGFVNLGRSSSDLSKDEMAQLLELIAAFGAQHGVKFADEQEQAA